MDIHVNYDVRRLIMIRLIIIDKVHEIMSYFTPNFISYVLCF